MSSNIEEVRKVLSAVENRSDLFHKIANVFQRIVPGSRVFLRFEEQLWSLRENGSLNEFVPLSPENENPVISRFENEGAIDPLFIHDTRLFSGDARGAEILQAEDIRSFGALPLYSGESICGFLEIQFSGKFFRWRKDLIFLLEYVAGILPIYLEKFREETQYSPDLNSSSSSHDLLRLLEYGGIVVLKTDLDFQIREVHGDTMKLLGVSSDELTDSPKIWLRCFERNDLQRLLNRIYHEDEAGEFHEEIRIANSKPERWLHIRVAPLLDEHGVQTGWEGFGIDVTERRKTGEELLSQGKRIRALYEVSRALVVDMDPALVTLKGLRALLRATGSDAGLGCFYYESSQSLELVASEGLSEKYIDKISEVLSGKNLLRYSIEQREGLLLEDITQDNRAAVEIARQEGLRSTVVMPLLCDDRVLGAIAIFRRNQNPYSLVDFELVSAAAGQIAIAARQAEHFLAEKRNADSLGAMYRLSHELSKVQNPKDVAEHAFPIIQEELACKRMWLGVVNDQGTHLIGKAGYGPGVRKHVINIQIELDIQHDFLDEAIETKRPVIFRPGEDAECSGLRRLLQRLNPGVLVIVPLVSFGHVVGVLVIEPAVASEFFVQRKLPLLRSMSHEIASVLRARQFEARIAESEKMRMAGVLASGVAHNFNNLLQAVMGQASLIEMQAAGEDTIKQSARTIISSANRGASLVQQLLSFSSGEQSEKEMVNLKELLSSSEDFYRSILGSDVVLEWNAEKTLPQVFIDYGQIQQVMSNLLMNAREAIVEGGGGYVRISAERVSLRSGEVSPELAPGWYLRLNIEDDGVGMDEEMVQRCFEPFYTSKELDEDTGLGLRGSGLGLSSTYSIMQQHEGAITVRSTPGEGTEFSLFFPIVQALVSAAKQPEDQNEEASIRLLSYHMQPGSVSILRQLSKASGQSLQVLENEGELLATLQSNWKGENYLFIDLDRIGSDPFGAVQSLLEKNESLTVFASAGDEKRWSTLFRQEGRVRVVEKPFTKRVISSFLKQKTGNKTASFHDTLSEEKNSTEVSKDLNQSTGAQNGRRTRGSLTTTRTV